MHWSWKSSFWDLRLLVANFGIFWAQFETLWRSFLKNISTHAQCTLGETTEFLKWSLLWFLLLSVCLDGSAVVVGAPGSPLQVECSDVNRDYVFLSWMPPSADGAAAVQGYFIERWNTIHDVLLMLVLLNSHLERIGAGSVSLGINLEIKDITMVREYKCLSFLSPSNMLVYSTMLCSVFVLLACV